MNHTPGAARQLAYLLTHHAAQGLPSRRAFWADPMRCEVESIESDMAALRWAVGCVVASYAERINPMSNSFISPLLGVAALIFVVFFSYMLHGGNMVPIIDAFPVALMTVGLGALVISSIRTSAGGPGLFKSMGLALRGRRFHKADYRDLAAALMGALNAARPSPLAGRNHAFLSDEAAARMIQDAQALTEQNQLAAEHLGSILQARIDSILAGQRRAVQVLGALARNLLWLGSVYFLLGAIMTLISFTEPPEVVGGMLASSTVGPLFGVLLAIGIFQPLANRLEAAIADDGNFYAFIRTAFFCKRAAGDGTLAVRTACGALPADLALGQEDMAALPDLASARPA